MARNGRHITYGERLRGFAAAALRDTESQRRVAAPPVGVAHLETLAATA